MFEISIYLVNAVRHGASLMSRQTHILFMKLHTDFGHVIILFLLIKMPRQCIFKSNTEKKSALVCDQISLTFVSLSFKKKIVSLYAHTKVCTSV